MIIGRPSKPITWVIDGYCIRCTSHLCNQDGYAHKSVYGHKSTICRVILARRFARQKRVLTPDIVCRHTCDNRWCINPAHLISGYPADNSRDMVERGRVNPTNGEKNGQAKITSNQVIQIRKMEGTKSQTEIAKEFGVSRRNVSFILNRKRWRHVR